VVTGLLFEERRQRPARATKLALDLCGAIVDREQRPVVLRPIFCVAEFPIPVLSSSASGLSVSETRPPARDRVSQAVPVYSGLEEGLDLMQFQRPRGRSGPRRSKRGYVIHQERPPNSR
jgi:hypothetical protein